MAVFNTYNDAANTAVRAFLTKVGAYYYKGKKFDTSNGHGKRIWESIKSDFGNSCCYCGKTNEPLGMEHLVMFNRTEFGLHHPGNVVPCCKNCNKRTRGKDKKPMDWRSHLKVISGPHYEQRLRKIEFHIKKYEYPDLSNTEIKTIKVIAESLYRHIIAEGDKSFVLYAELRKEFL